MIKRLLKQVLTFPQILRHRIMGEVINYEQALDFFRYFPFATIKNQTAYIGKIKLYFGNLPPMSAGIFSHNGKEYSRPNVVGKDVIDLGAALGDTIVYFASAKARNVFGYEFNLRYYNLAKINIKLNNLQDKASVEFCGVASKKIAATDVILGAIVPNEDLEDINSANFKTLDQILEEKNIKDGVLKVDVDGFEYEIFRSVSVEGWNRVGQIIMEYHYGTQDLKTILESAGFKVEIEPTCKVEVGYHPDAYKNMDIGHIYATR